MNRVITSAIIGSALLLGAAPSWAGFNVVGEGEGWIHDADGSFLPNSEARMRCGDNCPADSNPHTTELIWFSNPGSGGNEDDLTFESGELVPFSISYEPSQSTYTLDLGGETVTRRLDHGANTAYCRIGLQLKRDANDTANTSANIKYLSINGDAQGSFSTDDLESEDRLKYVIFENENPSQSINSVSGKLRLAWDPEGNSDGEAVAAGVIFPTGEEGDICDYTPTPQQIPTMDRTGLFALALGLFAAGWFFLFRRRRFEI